MVKVKKCKLLFKISLNKRTGDKKELKKICDGCR